MRKLLVHLFIILASLNSSGQGYNLVGNSTQSGGDCFILTQAQQWQNGAIWYEEAINISEPFSLQFTINFGNLDAAGADGMVFVMQQVGNEVIGVPGAGMGFEGFSPSLGVEFDSFQNVSFGDPAFDHLAINTNGNPNHNLVGNLAGPVPISPTSDNVEDGQDYVIDISWDPSSNTFSVSVNCEVRLQVNVNLEFFVFTGSQDVFWGFTGATGGEFNEQRICLDPFILGLPETFAGCAGQPVQLEAPPASFGTVTWEPAEFLDDPNSFSPIATVDQDTEFTLTFEDLCGNVQTEQTTIVIEEPSVDLGEDIAECEGNEILLSASGNFDDIAWSDGSQGNTFAVTESGTYWVDVVSGSCQVSDTVEVEVVPLPSYNGETDVELCSNEEFVFQLDPAIDQIEWFDGSNDATRTFDQSGTYSFELFQGDCSSDYELGINVIDLSDFSLGPDISICEGQDVVVSASGTFEGITWSDNSQGNDLTVTESGTYWADVFSGDCEATDTVVVQFDASPSYDGELNADLCEGEEFEFDLGELNYEIIWFDGSDQENRVFDQDGEYPFELTDGDCTADYQVEVTVTPIPEFDLGPDITICEGATAVLTVVTEDASITWNTGSSDLSISVTDEGTFWALAENNDCSFSDTIAVATTPVPDLILSGTESLCPGEDGIVSAISSAPVNWTTGDTDSEILINQPGVYTATATNAEGCSKQESVFVVGLSLPRIDPIEDLLKCQEEEFILVKAVSSDDANLEWSNGSSANSARYSDPGSHYVELSNACGRTREEFQLGEKECFDLFFLPTAFTPDGDGLNDLLKPQIDDFITYELQIFNRAGELVFESKDPNEGWNGSFQNDEYFCPAGVYGVRYSIDFGENILKEGFGSVVLIR